MITRIKESSSWAIRLVVEDGIKPDVYVNMDKILEEGIEQGDIESQKKDPLIEKAFEILSE